MTCCGILLIDKNDCEASKLKYCFDDVRKYISEHVDLQNAVISAAKMNKLHISTAESCTGGLLSATITEVSGSSEIFEGGVVTYANRIKNKLIGVSEESLVKFGAVSKRTAFEMSEGVLKLIGSDISAAVTGIAGPGGGTVKKPVGLVYISVSSASTCWKKLDINSFLKGNCFLDGCIKEVYLTSDEIDLSDADSDIGSKVFECRFNGSRHTIRQNTVYASLFLILVAILNY